MPKEENYRQEVTQEDQYFEESLRMEKNSRFKYREFSNKDILGE